MNKPNQYFFAKLFPAIRSNAFYAFDYYKRMGFFSLVKLIFAKLGISYFHGKLVFFILDLHQCRHQLSSEYSFEIPTITEIDNDCNFDGGFFSKRKTIKRILRENVLFIEKENSHTKFNLWVERNVLQIWWFNDTQIILPSNSIYVSGVYTAPEYRNRGVATQAKKEIFHYLYNQGVKYIFEAIHPKNDIAIELDKKFGFRECLILEYKKIFVFRRYTVRMKHCTGKTNYISVFKTPKSIKFLILAYMLNNP